MYMMTRKSGVGSGKNRGITFQVASLFSGHHEMTVSPQIRLLSESGHPQIRLASLFTGNQLACTPRHWR